MSSERFWEPGEAPVKVNEEDHARLADWVEDNVLQALDELMDQCGMDMVFDNGIPHVCISSFDKPLSESGRLENYEKRFLLEDAIKENLLNGCSSKEEQVYVIESLSNMLKRLSEQI